jgi:CheY-like chemotaxis protein/PAS domain-containing protein
MTDQPSSRRVVADHATPLLHGIVAGPCESGAARFASDCESGHWTLNRRLNRLRWSPELRALHGLGEHDPLPDPTAWLHTFVHADDRARTRRVLAHWRRAGTRLLQHGLRLVRPDGTVRELLTHTLADAGDGSELAFGVVVDVTPLRRTQEALRQAEGRVALTANAVGLGTWQVDLRSGEVLWDDNMWRLRGLAPRPMALDFEQRLALVHPDDRERMRLINSQGLSANYEFRVLGPDGQVHWLAARATTLTDDDGRPLRRIGINWEVTAQRQAEAAAREREAALRESQARSRTLARMSHELRTPLNAILGCAQLLRGGELDDPVLRERRVAEIEAAGRQLLTLVDRVLDLSERTAAQAAPAAARPLGPATAAKTLLYIEDNSVNAMIVTALVQRRSDLRIVVAETGQEGLARAVELQPALVLLDMQLPDLDGSEVFRRLRADPRTAALPCIALSANAMQQDIDAALASGIMAYWTKPLDFQRFARSMDEIFGPAPLS